jgi:hypothetical protein
MASMMQNSNFSASTRPQLSRRTTYLGHSSVVCTYWYIEAIPELLELATEFQRTSIQGGRQ